MPMSQNRTNNFIYNPFLQERVENRKKKKESLPSAFFSIQKGNPVAVVWTWAWSDSAAGWEQYLHPRCLFYESAERPFASWTVISIGHLCIKEPWAAAGELGGKTAIVCDDSGKSKYDD